MLVVEPRTGVAEDVEVLAPVHTYDGRTTVGGGTGVQRVRAAAGDTVRVRVANTDSSPLEVAVTGAAYRVLAVDARDVRRPTPVTDRTLRIPAGGRADLGVQVPVDGSGVLIGLGADGRNAILVGPDEASAPRPEPPGPALDLLSYGSPAPLFDPDRPDRVFDYSIGREPGFVDGRPGRWWTINGRLFPDVPMFVVVTGTWCG